MSHMTEKIPAFDSFSKLIDAGSNDIAYRFGVLAGIEFEMITRGEKSRFMRKAQAEKRLTPTIYAKAVEKGHLQEIKHNPNVKNSPIIVDRVSVIDVEHIVLSQELAYQELMSDD